MFHMLWTGKIAVKVGLSAQIPVLGVWSSVILFQPHSAPLYAMEELAGFMHFIPSNYLVSLSASHVLPGGRSTINSTPTGFPVLKPQECARSLPCVPSWYGLASHKPLVSSGKLQAWNNRSCPALQWFRAPEIDRMPQDFDVCQGNPLCTLPIHTAMQKKDSA